VRKKHRAPLAFPTRQPERTEYQTQVVGQQVSHQLLGHFYIDDDVRENLNA